MDRPYLPYKITFAYENDVSRGLLSNKQATVIITSGGTVGGNDVDYATGYIRHILDSSVLKT
ncbi:MAG: hypothetical protein CM15mP115_07350 [Alphaproteobacteria bacterium]|nr:MAG: hypothetical protein CM15mP115_07350 [Alphaproteobacteria bacterium]